MNETEYRSLVERDTAHMIHPQHYHGDRNAVVYVKGEGAVLTDAMGRQYIDGLSSLWNVAVGHGRKELAEAAAAQMSELAFSNAYSASRTCPLSSWQKGSSLSPTPTWRPSSSQIAAPRPTRSRSSSLASTGTSRARRTR